MTVSLCVVAYNEGETLNSLFNDIKNQDYPHDKMEIVLIDSASSDNTKALMEQFKQENTDFKNVQVLDNPKRKQACGWNVAIQNFKEEIMIRVDAHSSIPKNFVSNNVKCHETGEYVTGGKRPNIIIGETQWKKTLLLAESSMFGSSFASYRNGTSKTYVKSLFHGAYKREVLEKVGLFNEKLGRTEDNEFHYRIREAGYKICMDPDIISYQHARSSLSKMLKQKYGNGYWIGLTLGVCPGCISMFHLVPFAFILGIIFTSVLALCGFPLLSMLMWGAYITVALGMTVVAIMQNGFKPLYLTLPFLFFLLHVSYGIGTTVGLIKMPAWKSKYKE